MSNRDFEVTVYVTFRKTYVVNARDEEYAFDYAADEAMGDTYDPQDIEQLVEVDMYDIQDL